MKKATAHRRIGVVRDPHTGQRDLSAESADMLRSMRRYNYLPMIIGGVIVILVIGALWLTASPTTGCTGSQSIVVQPGDTLESIIRLNVQNIDSVDSRIIVDVVAQGNGLDDYDIGHLQPGDTINKVPTICGV